MKYEKIIDLLTKRGLKIPNFMVDKIPVSYLEKDDMKNIVRDDILKVKKILNERSIELNRYFETISSSEIQYLCKWLENNIVPYLKDIYMERNNGEIINLKSEVIEFENLHKYYLDVDESWIDDVLQCAKEIDTTFYDNLKKANSHGLWDIGNYYGKCSEGFSIYLVDDDLTYISIAKEDNKTDKIYLAHEVGHAYYNFIHKKKIGLFNDFVDTEYEATKFSILCMLNENKEIFDDFISNILSDICLKMTNIYLSIQLAKYGVDIDKITQEYFQIISKITPWIVDDIEFEKSFMKYNWLNIVLVDRLDKYDVYYLISELKALYWGIENNIITNMKFKGESLCEIITRSDMMF